MISIRLLSASVVAALLIGCGGNDKPPENPAPPTNTATPAPTENPPTTPGPTSSVTVTGIQLDSQLASACGIAPPKAFFEYDSAQVKGSATPALDSVAECVNSGPLKGRKLRVVGHADPRGPDEYNKQLGKTRADAVAEELSKRGVDRGKINTISRGEEKATGEAQMGYAYDRRVDIRLEP